MLNNPLDRRRFRLGLPILLAAALLGCGKGSLPDPASPELAKQALRTALDVWQKGEPTEALTKRTPPIYFNDHKVGAGMSLTSYEVEDGHEFFGQSVRLHVKATVRQKDSPPRERKLTYLIDTSPAVVIVPD